jgi:ribosomal protein S27E
MSNRVEFQRTPYRDIKIPEPLYENARILRQHAFEAGFGQIPTQITSPTKCPLCEGSLESFQAAYQYVRCAKCGYSQQQLAAGGSGTLGLGIIIGLGLAALAHMISESESSGNRKRYGRRHR